MSEKLRIVLVEDNSADAYLIETSLREGRIDYELVRFDHGEAALEHVQRLGNPEAGLPDVFLVDLHLPGSDGLTVLRAIRREPRLAHVPVVIMTGACPEHLGEVDLSGANRIVHKSMDLDEYMRDVAGAVQELHLSEPDLRGEPV